MREEMINLIVRANEELPNSLVNSLNLYKDAAEIADRIGDPIGPTLRAKIQEIKEVLWKQGNQ
jgi:hypothetical protein